MPAPDLPDHDQLAAALDALAAAIARHHPRTDAVLLLGIARGGVPVARALCARLAALGHPAPVMGSIDGSFHRDDIGRNPIPAEQTPTQIPADVSGATVILVDDVIASGRTAKAALDELFDQGRPAKVELAVWVDRGGRCLPIAPDYTGLQLTLPADRKLRLLPAEPGASSGRHRAELVPV
jgi:pyrimidine operon attenuation protein/uracil phosphoribosyltransferase